MSRALNAYSRAPDWPSHGSSTDEHSEQCEAAAPAGAATLGEAMRRVAVGRPAEPPLASMRRRPVPACAEDARLAASRVETPRNRHLRDRNRPSDRGRLAGSAISRIIV